MLGNAGFPGRCRVCWGMQRSRGMRSFQGEPAPSSRACQLPPWSTGSHSEPRFPGAPAPTVPWRAGWMSPGSSATLLGGVSARVAVCVHARACVCISLHVRKHPLGVRCVCPHPVRVCARAAHACTAWVCGVWMHGAHVCAHMPALCTHVLHARVGSTCAHACRVLCLLCARHRQLHSGAGGGIIQPCRRARGGGHGGHAMLASHTHTHIHPPPPRPSLLPRQQGEPGASLGTGYHQPLPPRCGGPGCPQGGWRWPGGWPCFSDPPAPWEHTAAPPLGQHPAPPWALGCPKAAGAAMLRHDGTDPPAAGRCLARPEAGRPMGLARLAGHHRCPPDLATGQGHAGLGARCLALPAQARAHAAAGLALSHAQRPYAASVPAPQAEAAPGLAAGTCSACSPPPSPGTAPLPSPPQVPGTRTLKPGAGCPPVDSAVGSLPDTRTGEGLLLGTGLGRGRMC